MNHAGNFFSGVPDGHWIGAILFRKYVQRLTVTATQKADCRRSILRWRRSRHQRIYRSPLMRAYFLAAEAAPPHSYLALTGGAIGQGLPCAVGAAVACPERKVIALQADGSGLYTLQALWTQAREGLDVVTVLCANRSYRILQIELARAGVSEPGPAAQSLTDLSKPVIDWVELAQGMGVPAARVETGEALAVELRRAFAEPGPRLLEVVL